MRESRANSSSTSLVWGLLKRESFGSSAYTLKKCFRPRCDQQSARPVELIPPGRIVRLSRCSLVRDPTCLYSPDTTAWTPTLLRREVVSLSPPRSGETICRPAWILGESHDSGLRRGLDARADSGISSGASRTIRGKSRNSLPSSRSGLKLGDLPSTSPHSSMHPGQEQCKVLRKSLNVSARNLQEALGRKRLNRTDSSSSLTFFSRIPIPSVPNLPRKETLDLSMIADRVNPQTWSLFQALRTRMRQLKVVSMKVLYEKHSSESTPAFFYEGRQLYHLHLRGSEMSATFHTDFKSRLRLTENQTIDWRLRDEIRKRSWAGFAFQSSKDLGPFMELVKAKYQIIAEEAGGKPREERPIAF